MAREDDVIECENCEHETVPEPSNRGERVCTWCGCYTDDNGDLHRSDDKRCPDCHGPVAYGPYQDAQKGIRSYWCPGCDVLAPNPEDNAPDTGSDSDESGDDGDDGADEPVVPQNYESPDTTARREQRNEWTEPQQRTSSYKYYGTGDEP